MLLNGLELLGKLRITDFAVIKIRNANADAMFPFACAEIM